MSSDDLIISSIEQLSKRIDDTGATIRLESSYNHSAHREILKKIDVSNRSISKLEKSITEVMQGFADHLKEHELTNKKISVKNVNKTTLIGSFGSALIGAIVALYISGAV